MLYFNQSNQAVLTCLDAKTGAIQFGPKRLGQLSNIIDALAVAAVDRLYMVGRGGSTLVLEHAGEFKVLVNNLLDERLDASPAMVGEQLFLRGAKFLYCIEEHQ